MRISSHLVLFLLLSLTGSWLHYVVVPHHFCFEHQAWVHENEESAVADSDLEDDGSSDEGEVMIAYQLHSHEKCEDCINSRKFFQRVISSLLSSPLNYGPASFVAHYETFSSEVVYILAPKNSPPFFA
jgi:hypothetical protein